MDLSHNRLSHCFAQVEAGNWWPRLAGVGDRPAGGCGPDVRVAGGGTTYFHVYPLSPRAGRWVRRHVEVADWQWAGGGFAVHALYVRALVRAMRQDGLAVEA